MSVENYAELLTMCKYEKGKLKKIESCIFF